VIVLEVQVVTVPHHAPHGRAGSLPGRQERADKPSLHRLNNTLRAHRSKGSHDRHKETGQDEQQSTALGEQAPLIAYPTRRFGRNQFFYMDKVELRRGEPTGVSRTAT